MITLEQKIGWILMSALPFLSQATAMKTSSAVASHWRHFYDRFSDRIVRRVSELASSLIGIQVPGFRVVGSSPMPSALLLGQAKLFRRLAWPVLGAKLSAFLDC